MTGPTGRTYRVCGMAQGLAGHIFQSICNRRKATEIPITRLAYGPEAAPDRQSKLARRGPMDNNSAADVWPRPAPVLQE